MQALDVSYSPGIARDLLVFTTSMRPDPYVNSLAFLLRAGGLQRVTFINIQDPADRPTESAGAVLHRVRALVQSLSNGKYPTPKGDNPVDRRVAECYQDMMRQLNSVTLGASTWERDALPDKLRIAVARGTLFDVTALRKDLLADVITLLISLGHPAAFTFELKSQLPFDERSLYYVIATSDFSYSNLLAGENVARAVKRVAIGRRSRRNLLITSAAILPVVVTVNLLWSESLLAGSLNWIAGAASIVSWLAYFIGNDQSS